MVGMYDFVKWGNDSRTQSHVVHGDIGAHGYDTRTDYLPSIWAYARVDFPEYAAEMLEFYCQVYDNDTAKSMTVSLVELWSDDNGIVRENAITRISSSFSGAPGHTKIQNLNLYRFPIKQWVWTGSAYRYHTYYIKADLRDDPDIAVKHCTVSWD